jgi:RHS repeat-associated protein
MSISHRHLVSNETILPSRMINLRQVNKIATRLIHTVLIASMLAVNLSGAVATASASEIQPSNNYDTSNNLNVDGSPLNSELIPPEDRETSTISEQASAYLSPSLATGIRTGRVIYEGLLDSVDTPIPAVQGHRHALQIAFQVPNCGNCGASGFIGDYPNVWPSHILAMCFTGYGPAQQCTTDPFVSPGSELYVDIWDVPWVSPQRGILRVVDLDMSPGVPLNSTLSDCQPKDGQGDPRECQVNGSSNTQGYAGDPINTQNGGYHTIISDLSFSTSAGPLIFQRTYSSLAAEISQASSLGPGWTHNHDSRLIFPDDPGGEEYTVWFKAHTANFYGFQIVGNGSYAPLPGVLATLTYQAGSPARYILKDRAQQIYTFDEEGKLLTWSDAIGHKFHYSYDEEGLLISVSDDSDLRFYTVAYDAQDRITSVTDHTDRSITFSYDGNGDLVSMEDVSQETWMYEYDDHHRLIKISDPRGVDSIRLEYDEEGRAVRQYDGLGNKTVELTYESEGRTVLTDALDRSTTHIYNTEKGVLIQEIDAQGGVIERTYDVNFRPGSVKDALGNVSYLEWSDDGNNLERTIDAAGFETIMDYNATNRLEQVTDPLLRTTDFNYEGPLLQNIVDALGYTTSYIYTTEPDAPQPVGLLKRITDPLLNATEYQYNAFGDRVEVENALGNAWTYQYNDLGWLTEARDPNGVLTIYMYDDAGRIVEIMENYIEGKTIAEDGEYNILTQYVYDEVGNLEYIIDTLGKADFFQYDDANRLIRITRNYVPTAIPDSEYNISTEFHYDLLGNQIAIVDPLGTITRTYFDSLDRPIVVVQNLTDWDIANPNPPAFDPEHPDQNVPSYYNYDVVGNLISVEDALGTTSYTCYDPRSLPIKSITNPTVGDPCSSYSGSSDPALDIVNQWSYDSVGNLLSWKDPLGSITSYGYDDLNRLETITNPLGFVTTFDYDPLGNLTTMTDAEGIVTQYQVDAISQLSDVIQNYRPGTPEDHETNVTTSYFYDSVGNLILILDANEGEWSYTYDGLNRLRTELMPMGGITGYSYDALGNLTDQIDPNMNIIHYNYDLMDRLVNIDYADPDPDVSFTYDEVGNPLSMLDGLGTTAWEYDSLYRPISVKDPFNHVIGYAYNAIGNRTGLTYADGKTVSYAYDAAQRLIQVQDWDGAKTNYAYDKAGQPITAVLPNGVISKYAWDAAGNLETLTHKWNARTLASYAYSYDKLGNRTQAVERLQRPAPSAEEYPYIIYFPNASVVSERSPYLTIDYTYDPLYRLTAADYSSDEFFHYSYDAAGNRLSEATHEGTHQYSYDEAHRITDVDGVSYDWDPAGNLLSDGERTFSYNHADRLTSITDGSSTYAFAYDGLGNRYQQSIDGTTTTYSLDIAADLTQVLGDGTNAYLYGLGPIGKDGAGGWQYSLQDALGSVRQLSDPSSSIILSQSYEPFGASLKVYGKGSRTFGFTGEQDGIAGLVFLRARYYDPGTGRFITKDPFPGVPSLPSTLHLYQYALNNPINFVDPSGEIIPAIITAMAAGVIIGGVMGGIGYALSHPGQSLGDMLSSACFWQAVLVGEISGAIAGAVGWAVGAATPALMLKYGLTAKMTLGLNIGFSFLSGSAASIVGQFTTNLLLGMDLGEGLAFAAFSGGIIGMVTGGIGYKLHEWMGNPKIDWSSYPQNPKVPKPKGPIRVIEGAEYEIARAQANAANRALHRANPSLQGLHIHEIKPVKFGGNPVDIVNKVPLTPAEHMEFTKWWNNLLNMLLSE